MAHDVIGLDLGANRVKAVVVRVALRGSEVVQVDSERVELGEHGRARQQAVIAAAGRLVRRLELTGETVHCMMSGELASVQHMTLPTSAGRRLEQVLKFELDELLPFDIEDAVFDFVETGREGEEISVVAATAIEQRVADLIEGLQEEGISPREIGVAPLSYVTGLTEELTEWNETGAFVDIGHERTNIVVLDRLRPTVRTVLRGGRDLTAKLAEVGKADFEKAESYKREQGLSGRVGKVLREALRPLVREIQQTLKGHQASGGERVDRVFLAGGGGLLKGLAAHLMNEIGVKVERYSPPLGADFKGSLGQEPTTFALAYSLARREDVARAKRIDLRKGDLAFKGDYEFLRRRIGWMVACVLAVFLSWLVASFAEYKVLGEEAERQKAVLIEKTTRLFKAPMTSYEEIEKKLGGVKVADPPMPKKDAFDIVLELSRRIPASVVHDVELLEIKPKRITLRGIVDAELKTAGASSKDAGPGGVDGGVGSDLSPTDLIKMRLEQFKECFAAIRVGKVTLAGERRKYQMDIDSRCP